MLPTGNQLNMNKKKLSDMISHIYSMLFRKLYGQYKKYLNMIAKWQKEKKQKR